MQVIKRPVSTEKAIRLLDSENKLVFVVDRKATKSQVKVAVEAMFNVKVDAVKTVITPKGIKKAYVRLSAENPAIDVATNLGLM